MAVRTKGKFGTLTFATLATVVVVTILTGCTSVLVKLSGVASEEDIQRYVNLPPFEFVKQRFYEEEQSPVMDGILKGAQAYAKLFGGYSREADEQYTRLRKPEIRPDVALVTWPAYFTNANYIQLIRPAVELRRFCKARGGEWQVVQRHDEDLVAALRRDPTAAFIDAHARVTRYLKSQGAYVGFEELRDVLASQVGAEMAEEAAQRNRREGSVFSVEGFRYAQRLDGFGLFNCEQRNGERWLASILPTTLISSDLNASSSTMARLAIRAYEESKRAHP